MHSTFLYYALIVSVQHLLWSCSSKFQCHVPHQMLLESCVYHIRSSVRANNSCVEELDERIINANPCHFSGE
jgi:hypothetical protein